MGISRNCMSMRGCLLLLYLTIASITSTQSDARRTMRLFRGPTHPTSSIIKPTKKLRVTKHLDVDSSNTGPYVSSPFSLPPFDSLAPIPLPENAPPFCIYPPFTPQPPSTAIPTPIGYTPSAPPPPSTAIPTPIGYTPSSPPPPSTAIPTPIGYTPSSPPPPSTAIPTPIGYTPSSPPPPPLIYYLPPLLPIQSPPPSPTGTVPGPPQFSPTPNPPAGSPEPVLSPPTFVPSPPSYIPSPPSYVPSPGGFVPTPPVFQPPVVYPPPTVPPSPNRGPSLALWCVAKPSVPDPIIEEAMNYACGSGADCASIQPEGSCFKPNTLFAHASYAFNSYWQRTKVAGGTCSFGGTGMLVTVDPSYDGCHFMYY